MRSKEPSALEMDTSLATLLTAVPLFRDLSPEETALVLGISHIAEVSKGQVICSEGEVPDVLYVILEGIVRISKRVPGVGEEAMALLTTGAHFGEMALLGGEPRSATAVAHEPCRLLVIEGDAMQRLMAAHPSLAMKVLWTLFRTLALRLRETNDKLSTLFTIARTSQ